MLTRIILYDPQLTIIPVSLILGLHSILHVKQIIIAPLSLSWAPLLGHRPTQYYMYAPCIHSVNMNKYE